MTGVVSQVTESNRNLPKPTETEPKPTVNLPKPTPNEIKMAYICLSFCLYLLDNYSFRGSYDNLDNLEFAHMVNWLSWNVKIE